MFTKFLSLKPEKRERIINAALKEFAQKGFDNASTNEIVKEANISKGLLFHYFKSKKDLFLFLYDYFIDVFNNEYFGKIDFEGRDLFDVLMQAGLLKVEIYQRYPYMFGFANMTYFDIPSSLKDELTSKNQLILTDFLKHLRESIDVSKFREGVDIDRAINVVGWTLEGMARQERDKLKLSGSVQIEFESLKQVVLEEADRYMALLRACFYK